MKTRIFGYANTSWRSWRHDLHDSDSVMSTSKIEMSLAYGKSFDEKQNALHASLASYHGKLRLRVVIKGPPGPRGGDNDILLYDGPVHPDAGDALDAFGRVIEKRLKSA